MPRCHAVTIATTGGSQMKLSLTHFTSVARHDFPPTVMAVQSNGPLKGASAQYVRCIEKFRVEGSLSIQILCVAAPRPYPTALTAHNKQSHRTRVHVI